MSKAVGIRFVVVALAVAALLVVCGCGGDSTAETASAPRSSTVGGSGDDAQGKTSPSTSAQQDTSTHGTAEESTTTRPTGGPGPTEGKKAHIVPPKGPQEPAPTAEQRAAATVASMSLSSPVLQPGPESVSTLPAAYTCDGKNTWPALRWAGVPAGTTEMVLFALNLEPVNEAFFFDWAVAGLDPSLEALESGRLPKGAVAGRNSFGKNGYSICPAAGNETIIFALYALPSPISVSPGFDPMVLRKQVLDSSGNAGLMAVSYGRG